jgi:hypothetical protein
MSGCYYLSDGLHVQNDGHGQAPGARIGNSDAACAVLGLASPRHCTSAILVILGGMQVSKQQAVDILAYGGAFR